MWIIIGSLYFEWEGPTDNYGQGPTDNYGQGPTDNCGSTEWSIIGTHKVGGTHSVVRDPLLIGVGGFTIMNNLWLGTIIIIYYIL